MKKKKPRELQIFEYILKNERMLDRTFPPVTVQKSNVIKR